MFKRLFYILMLSCLSSFAFASSYDAELLRLTNAQRAQQGVSALCLSPQLGQAAQAHAEDMARQNYFSHSGLNGSNVAQRVQATGYQYGWIGENISAGRATAAETLDGWMQSSGHRANILKGDYKEVGFGYAQNASSDYKHYWVQVFATPKGGSSCAQGNQRLDQAQPISPPPPSMPNLRWFTDKRSAMAQARREGKLVLMVAGRDTCGVTNHMRKQVIQQADVQAVLRDKFVLWYSNVDHASDYQTYLRGVSGSFRLPVMAVIAPQDSERYIDRSFGSEKKDVFANWLRGFSTTHSSPQARPPIAVPPRNDGTPVITGITPPVVPPLPAGKRQWLHIEGRNFNQNTKMQLAIVGGRKYGERLPHKTSPNRLSYNINVGPDENTWEVQVNNNGRQSNTYRFQVRRGAVNPNNNIDIGLLPAEPEPTGFGNPGGVIPPSGVISDPNKPADIRACESYFLSFHLTLGEDGTAFQCYQDILRRSPNNQQARFGLEKIEVYYFARIKSASDKGLWQEAQLYMDRLRGVNPQSAYLRVFNAGSSGDSPAGHTSVQITEQQNSSPYFNLIQKASRKYRIPIAFIQSVIEVESGFDPRATSRVGAKGLMQIMPDTAQRFNVSDPYDPAQNIEGGVQYLRYLWEMFGGNKELILAAYNAGEGSVRQYGNKIPPIPETQNYVRKIMNLYRERTRS